MSEFYDQSPQNSLMSQQRAAHRSVQARTLEQYFSKEVLKYLEERIINYLYDAISLESHYAGIGSYYDYSFLVAPSYKAFEGYLFQLARDLKLKAARSPNQAGSYFYDEEAVAERVAEIISELETENTFGAEKERDRVLAAATIRDMKTRLQLYRNSPAHYLSEEIRTIEMAKGYIGSIRNSIEQLTKHLLATEIITLNTTLR